MNLEGWGPSIARAILFLAIAFLVLVQVWGTLFAIGDGGGTVGFLMGSWLAMTCAGILTLTVTAFGTLTKNRAFAFVGLVGALLVLPMAILYTWGMLRADIINSGNGHHVGPFIWIVDAGTLPLSLTAIFVLWRSLRRKVVQTR